MSEATSLIAAVVLVMGLGVAAQVLADRLEVPSVLFLLLAGVLVGPEGLSLVSLETFGTTALQAIVGLSVGIIVFEGAFHLSFDRVRAAPREALRLVTLGAFVSLVGTAVAVRLAFGAPWSIAVLVGSLLVATGPTVITPIMDVVPVRDRVSAVLETEGIVNDVTAAILAVATFEFVVAEEETPLAVAQTFGTRLAIGVAVGLVVGGALAALLHRIELSEGNAPRNARLLVLVGALIAYALAETQSPESGIAAAAVAGITLGNADIPYEEVVADFKGDVTLLALSFVFVVLAALLTFDDLPLSLSGVAVVVAVAAVIRPVGVLLSTVGDRLTLRERAFVSAVGPRGIIPASVATLFAIDLESRAAALRSAAETASGAEAQQLLARADLFQQGAEVLVGTVFLVIFATVLFEGGLARHVAQVLDVIPAHTLVVGGGRVGGELAGRFESRGEEVIIVDNDPTAVERLRNQGHRVVQGDATDADVLESARAGDASVVAAATADDDVNLLVAQLAKNRFGVETIVARANRPENVAAFDDLDIQPISAGFAVADAMDDAIERPALSGWLADATRSGDVLEVELTASDADELTVQGLSAELPSGCLVVMVSRDGEDRVPDPDTELRHGDHLTLVCQENEAMEEAVRRCRA